MKIPRFLNRLKIRKYLKGTRLVVVLIAATILLAGAASITAYTINLQNRKQPVVEETQSKPKAPVTKVEPQTPVAEEKPTAPENGAPAVNSTTPSAAAPAAKPRPHTSEDPAFTACTTKYSELYVKYNADVASINTEKNVALAIVDELYNSGDYVEVYPEGTDAYNQWQIDRAELIEHYNGQLMDLYNTYTANSSPYLNC